MRQLLLCRRTFIAFISIGALVAVAIINHADVALAISGIAVALGAANATESAMRLKYEAQIAAPKE